MDQPAASRFDGENNNWDLVDIADRPDVEITARMRNL